jgi:hypothetical protein
VGIQVIGASVKYESLQDIACLRDARTTVQMLLDQNNFPKALECIETVQEVLDSDLKGVACFRPLSTQLRELYTLKQQETSAFIAKFHEKKRQRLASILDSEQWKVVDLPPIFQQLVDEYVAQGVLRDVASAEITGGKRAIQRALERGDSIDGDLLSVSEGQTRRAGSAMSSTSSASQSQPGNQFVLLSGEKFIAAGVSLILLRILAQYCGLLQLFPQWYSWGNLIMP